MICYYKLKKLGLEYPEKYKYYTEEEIEEHIPDGIIPFSIERRAMIKVDTIIEVEKKRTGVHTINR